MQPQHPVALVCSESNDLYRVLVDCGYACQRFSSPQEALSRVATGTALLLLADTYPRPSYVIDSDLLAATQAKQLRLYVEYPATLVDQSIGSPQVTAWERVVVSSEFFAPTLPKFTILAQHGCWFVPMEAQEPLLSVARVAGYHSAIYGLPEEAAPILFEMGDSVLVATTKLSQFVTGRYAPQTAWKAIWERLLCWLTKSDQVPALQWSPTAGPSYGPDEALPPDAEQKALQRSVKWFRDQVVWSIGAKKGAIEGFESGIDHEGRQMRRAWARGDCIAESAMVMACAGALRGDPSYQRLAGQMLDLVWSAPDFLHTDPDSPAYGQVNWYERGPHFYGDDTARVLLSTLMSARLLNENRWDEHALRCLLANLRTTGTLGFRRNRIDLKKFPAQKDGWRQFYEEEWVSYAPHYQAYLWATYLWAYALTGFEGFLTRTKNALAMTMEVYPKWRWTNGITQEMARMLLPLAFLVRIEDTAEHREWLQRIADDLLACMQPCGAIHEQMGPKETGAYPSPSSNEAYGTNEASVIQQNGDPACDLLYTTNFALLGLHEAAAATKSPALQEAADRLTEFLLRIQVRSTSHPYLDGAWMRSFDYELWEYWGSSADQGWGAWCVESGWTNAWIAAVLAMRARGETLFSLEKAKPLQALCPDLVHEMLGQR